VGTSPVEGTGVTGRGEGGEVVVVGDGAFAAGGGVSNGDGADAGGFTVVGAGAEAFGGGVATGGDLVGEDAGEDEGEYCAFVEATRNVISIKNTMLLFAAISLWSERNDEKNTQSERY
jgi:hypothetical protein